MFITLNAFGSLAVGDATERKNAAGIKMAATIGPRFESSLTALVSLFSVSFILGEQTGGCWQTVIAEFFFRSI